MFAYKCRRNLLNTCVQTVLFDYCIDEMTMFLWSCAIFLNKFFLAEILKRFNYYVQLCYFAFSISDQLERIIVFWCFHTFNLNLSWHRKWITRISVLLKVIRWNTFPFRTIFFVFFYFYVKKLGRVALWHFKTVTTVYMHVTSALADKMVSLGCL